MPGEGDCDEDKDCERGLVSPSIQKTRYVCFKTVWKFFSFRCVEKTTVVLGALGSTPRMIAAGKFHLGSLLKFNLDYNAIFITGSHVMEMTVAVAKIMLVKRVGSYPASQKLNSD